MSNDKKVIKPERPGGFLDFLPADYLAREKMLDVIKKVFRSFGFDPIETPRVEFLKTLSGEQSDTGKNIFHIKNSQDNEPLALPFDHTVPFARLLAANPYNAQEKTGIRLPWRRMVVGPVFRGETPQSGRYRQFYQFDADIAGTSSMMADAEIVSMMYKTMSALGIEKFIIKINNRKILNGLAKVAGITDRAEVNADDITKEMMRIMDKLDKIGMDQVLSELKKKPQNDFDTSPNLGAEALEKVKLYLNVSGDNTQILDQCQEIFAGIETAVEGVEELRQILTYLKVANVPDSAIRIDTSIARGLDYYTGPVMETELLEAPEFGSVFSGGRYNDLVKRFTGNELPAVGASIGVDRLYAALNYLGLIDLKKQTDTKVMVLRIMPGKNNEYMKIASQIRELGINTEICLLKGMTFKNQFNFAINRGVKYVVICGEDEFNKQTIQIKNLDTREQKEVLQSDLKTYFDKEFSS